MDKEQLCEVSRNGDAIKLRALVYSGADISYFDDEGLTPLMHAAKHGQADAVKILLEAGIHAELILGTIARKKSKNGDCNDDYLEDRVIFSEDELVDSNSKAIMMAWKKPLVEAHAKAVCTGGGDILNVGFGMGLVDTAIQQCSPVTHTIIEAHAEVYERMLQSGWAKKPNVKIVFGR